MIRGTLGDQATFEIRLVTGPEGRQLSRAQARAVRELLQWAGAQLGEQRRAA